MNKLESVLNYINERATNIAKYSTKLRKNIETIETFINEIASQSGIYYTMILKEVTTNEDENHGVKKFDVINATGNGALFGYKQTTVDDVFETQPIYAYRQDRETLKLAVQQLPGFLAAYADKLKDADAEIVVFAEKAQKIADYAANVMK